MGGLMSREWRLHRRARNHLQLFKESSCRWRRYWVLQLLLQRCCCIEEVRARDEAELLRLAHDLRNALGRGGQVEQGRIVLQGDQRERVKDELLRLGFQLENIEVI